VFGAYWNESEWKHFTFLLCSQQIPHVLAWEPLGAMTRNNVTCGTGVSQWSDASSGMSQPRTKRASGTMEFLILKKLIHFFPFHITVGQQVYKQHFFAYLSSIVHYVLEMSLLYSNAYFREHFSSHQIIKWRTKLNELLCKLLSTSLFPVDVMIIEVQNLIHRWEYTII
jgi:hypothetical protein